jgi:hypothetical protein
VNVICYQADPIEAMGDFGLCFGEHCQEHITAKAFGNQKLSAVTPEGDVKGMTLRQLAE